MLKITIILSFALIFFTSIGETKSTNNEVACKTELEKLRNTQKILENAIIKLTKKQMRGKHKKSSNYFLQ